MVIGDQAQKKQKIKGVETESVMHIIRVKRWESAGEWIAGAVKESVTLKQLGGLALFVFGCGMAVMIFIPVNFWIILVISLLLIVGFNLFCH